MEGIFLFCPTEGVGSRFSTEVRWFRFDSLFFFFIFPFLPSSWLAHHLVFGSIYECLERWVYKRGFPQVKEMGEVEEANLNATRLNCRMVARTMGLG